MNEIKVISKSTLLGREVDVYGSVEEPLFKAKDIAEWLELTNVSDMVSRVDEYEVTKLNLGSLEGDTWFLTEDGLYEVLMQSRKPIAKDFKRGIKAILKEIRKTGSYRASEKPKDKVEAGLAWVEGCRKLLNLSDTSMLLLMEAIARPLGLPTPDYVPSRGVHHSASELLRKHNAGMSVIKFNELLRGKCFLAETMRKGKTRDHKYNFITAKGREYGENVVSPRSPNETQPHWYDEKFDELLSIIK